MALRSLSGLVLSLLALQREKRTGVVTVRTEGAVTFLYLRDGVLVFAEEGSFGETLGRLLVRQRQITQEQYVEIIGTMTDALVLNEQLRFGEVAVELGYLGEEQVRRALVDQIRWKIVRVFQRPEVSWQFEDSLARLDDVGYFPMHVEALVLETLRWVDDDTKLQLGLAAALDERLCIKPEAAPGLADRFGLTPAEHGFVLRLNGARTIAALLDSTSDDEVDTHALLTALIVTRAVGPAPTAKAASPAVPAPRARAARTALETPMTPMATFPAPAAATTAEAPASTAPAPAAPPSAAASPASAAASPASAAPSPGSAAAASPPSAAAAPAPYGTRPASIRRAQLPLSRTSKILRALEAQRVRPSASRDPSNDHESRLLAERALQRGLEHMRSGRYTQALEDVQRAAELQPESHEHRLYAKWCGLRARGELPHTVDRVELHRIATAAVGADPNFAFAYYVMGDLAMSDSRDREATRMLNRAIKLDPGLLDAQRLLRLLERRHAPTKKS
jgi:hypothetical protein